MKKRIAIILGLLVCCCLIGCGNSNAEVVQPSTQGDNVELSHYTEPTSAPAEILPESMNPLYQFSFCWEDMTVQFPGWFSEFYVLGEFDIEEEEEVVAPGEQRRNERDQMILYNCTSESLPAKKCAVAGVVLKDYDGDGGLFLPGDIEVGIATGEGVLATYGEPTYEQDGVLTYELERNRYVKLVLKDNVLVEAEICNMIPLPENTRNFEYALEDLKAYKFWLNDVEFQLPCRCSDLKDAGWESKGDAAALAEPGEGFEEMWTKDGFDIFVLAYNNTDTAASVMDCTIVGWEANELYSVPMLGEYSGELILPGDIKLFESTKTDLLLAYGEPTSESEYSDDILIYEFGEPTRGSEYSDDKLSDEYEAHAAYLIRTDYVEFEVDRYTEKLISAVYFYFPETVQKNK